MTSTHVGLPDRYRPLDEVGPVENTADRGHPHLAGQGPRAQPRRRHPGAHPRRRARARVDRPGADRGWPRDAGPGHGLRRLRGQRRPRDRRRRGLRRQRVDRGRDPRRAGHPGPDARARGPHGAAPARRRRRRGAPGGPGRRRAHLRERRPAAQRARGPARRPGGDRHGQRRHHRPGRPAGGLPHRHRGRRPGPAPAGDRPRPRRARAPRAVHRARPGSVQRRRHGLPAG